MMKSTATRNKTLLLVVCGICLLLGATDAHGADGSPSSDNFRKFFVDGGPLVWILLALSLVTIKLIVQYFLTIRRSQLLPGPTLNRADQLRVTCDRAGRLESFACDDSLMARTIHAGLAEGPHGADAVRLAVSETLEQDTANLLRKIEWLNLIGNVAPMIGLFGTVWGMIEAFNGIVQAGGQPQPADLAAGISVALVTTWWGLIVAIPALAAFGFLRNRIDSLTAEVALTAEKILADLAVQS